MKKEADLVLGAVTRRKTEANKFLTILSSLVKLRQIRSQAAERKGLHRSTARDDAFEQVTGKILLHRFEYILKMSVS